MGTNDGTTPAYNGGNIVDVADYEYDADGDVTQATAYQYSGAASTWHGSTPAARVMQMFYDWRDRLVATKSGVLVGNLSGETSDGAERPITYNVMDNLGEVTGAYVFSGSGVAVSAIANYTTDATPGSSSLLRSYSTTSYDTLGQVYRTAQYSVDQSSGAVGGTPEVTNNYITTRTATSPARPTRAAIPQPTLTMGSASKRPSPSQWSPFSTWLPAPRAISPR
ncbi:MAG: hypothetical protein ABR915_17425, partial [Thermoguttaceae bacterium]